MAAAICVAIMLMLAASYAAMGFSVLVESFNLLAARRQRTKRDAMQQGLQVAASRGPTR
jgi:hypothetical protein